MKPFASVIHHSGKDILLIDFSGLKGDAFLDAIHEVTAYILARPAGIHLPSITDLKGARLTPKIREAMKRMGKEIAEKKGHNGAGIVKVVIGLSPLERLVAGAITPGILYLDSREAAIRAILKDSA